MTAITGKLKLVYPEKQVSDKFKTREFVLLDEASQYPQNIKMQCTQDRCSLLDKFNVGDTINVHYNLRGREWTSKEGVVGYFNSIEAWKIEAVAASGEQSASSANTFAGFEQSAPGSGHSASVHDDDPF